MKIIKKNFFRNATLLALLPVAGLMSSCGDVDGDGYTTDEGDCNDNDSSVYPGATEVCDGVDQNCDGEIDEGLKTTYYMDMDGDAFGVDSNTFEACERPDSYAEVAGDCNDVDANINPSAVEVLGDQIDNNCNGAIDESNIMFKSVSSGRYHTLATTMDGSVWSWGDSSYGQTGQGSATSTIVPTAIENLKAQSVSAGWSFSLSLDNGKISSWGENTFGQLGNGSTNNSSTPVSVLYINNAMSISAGYAFAMALLADGNVAVWGNNIDGQFGNGTNTHSSTPIYMNISNVADVKAGYFHSVVLKTDGTVWTAGWNALGQLGNGTKNDSKNLVNVNISNVVSIASGSYHVLAMKNDGTVWGWGQNDFGALATGDFVNHSSPVQSALPFLPVRIIAGGGHSLAVDNQDNLWSWGENYSGQVGDGTLNDANQAYNLGTKGPILSVGAGEADSFAVYADGSVWGWGENTKYQLGNGTTNSSYSPTKIQ